MKLLFVTCLYPHELENEFRIWSAGDIQTAADVFQWNVINGLHENNVDFEVVSLPAMPSYPKRCRKLVSPHADIIFSGNVIGTSIRYSNLVVYKMLSMYYNLKKYLSDWVRKNASADEKIVILTYGLYPPFIRAILDVRKRYRNIIVSSIVTDLVDDMMNFHSNRTLLKQIQCKIETYLTRKYYKWIDKYILLSEHMVEKIPEAAERYVVLEGIAGTCTGIEKKVLNNKRILLYTGTLDEFSGVGELVDAFTLIANKECCLVICGDGPLKDKILNAGFQDERIVYRGRVSHEEALKLQKDATLLINPRRPDNSITRYSFPSKTLEYMASGTPMLAYKLDGIPDEYYSYCYIIDGMSVDDLSNAIKNVLFLPDVVLKQKAEEAYEFISSKKNPRVQISKALNFLIR